MNIGEALGKPASIFKYQPDERLVLPMCRLGLEFEFEGVRSHLPKKEGWSQWWNEKEDRSLHDNGKEFTFAEPWFGQDAVMAIQALCKWAQGKEFKTSIRTGLHVHVDVRDMTRAELGRLCVLYALFEKAIYRFVGNNREANVFCLPWYRADQMALHVNKICTEYRDLKSAAEALRDEKYGGLNLDSLVRFGTIEFRHALCTTDADWVLKWVNICLCFKKAAQKLAAQPLDLIYDLSAAGVRGFARLIFEDHVDTIWYDTLEHDLWSVGLETALLVYPKTQDMIDVARLSWNQKAQAAKEAASSNPRFRAFIEAKVRAGRKSSGGRFVIDEWADNQSRPDEDDEDFDDDDFELLEDDEDDEDPIT